MLPYQAQYIENVREIAALSDFYSGSAEDFERWYAGRMQARTRISALRQENIALLGERLFPTLDDLHSADAETIAALEEFADKLMDWSTNLDCGVYVLIHDALLSLYRIRRDRNRIIKELYKLGMGLYYQGRMVQGIETAHVRPFYFQNEMVFTEAGAYLKFFAEIDDEETKGYIIRALANISICTTDRKRRVAVTSRILRIVRDDYYRALAPGLPWDVFLRRTNQQMSANRNELSRGDFTPEELAAVLESCQEVFEPEMGVENPNVRWLWPFYEMEYSCGFVDLPTTLERLEQLIVSMPWTQYDVSGLYANIQLPIYYGRLLRDNPAMLEKPRYVRFLAEAYRKMMRTLLSYPAEKFDDFFQHIIHAVVTDYVEIEGVESYREIVFRLMQRLGGALYVDSMKAGAILRRCCDAIYAREPDFFDDIDFLRAMRDPEAKRETLLDYAGQCGLFHDFGLFKMNGARLSDSRNLFEGEFQMLKLHTIAGHDDLCERRSTEIFADAALGHHSWYNGAGGYPEAYVRNRSQYRQMTDVVAIAAYLVDHYAGDAEAVLDEVIALEQKRFSPLVTAYLGDEDLRRDIAAILGGDDRAFYREMYDQLAGPGENRD